MKRAEFTDKCRSDVLAKRENTGKKKSIRNKTKHTKTKAIRRQNKVSKNPQNANPPS